LPCPPPTVNRHRPTWNRFGGSNGSTPARRTRPRVPPRGLSALLHLPRGPDCRDQSGPRTVHLRPAPPGDSGERKLDRPRPPPESGVQRSPNAPPLTTAPVLATPNQCPGPPSDKPAPLTSRHGPSVNALPVPTASIHSAVRCRAAPGKMLRNQPDSSGPVTSDPNRLSRSVHNGPAERLVRWIDRTCRAAHDAVNVDESREIS
jgi:hypothetical protein